MAVAIRILLSKALKKFQRLRSSVGMLGDGDGHDLGRIMMVDRPGSGLQDPVVSLIWRFCDRYFTYPMLVHVRIYIVSPTVKYDRRYISLLEKYLDMLSCTEFFSAKSLHRILCRLTQNSVQTYTEFCADLHRILCTQNSVHTEFSAVRK